MKKKHKYLHETPEDKQLRQMLISMIGSVFLCIFCLVGTTWAYFETSFTSAESVLSVAEMKVLVSTTKGGTSTESNLMPTDRHTYMLEEIGTYTIELTNTGNIEGYCVITLADATGAMESFTSGTLYPAGYNTTDTATITIEITAEDNFNGILPVELKIKSYWGNDPYASVQNIDQELFTSEEETIVTEPTEGQTDPIEESTAPSEPEETTQATTQPSEPVETTPTGDNTETTPTGGNTETPSGDGNTETTPTGGNTETTPTGGNTETTPTGGNTETTPSDSNTDTTPTGGNTETPPSGGNAETTPTSGSTDTTNPGGNADSSQPGDDASQTSSTSLDSDSVQPETPAPSEGNDTQSDENT